MTLNFDSPFITKPKSNYTLTMFTLVNCGKLQCSTSQDTISVQIKEGVNGVFKEIYTVKRNQDDRWRRERVDFIASQDRVYVCVEF